MKESRLLVSVWHDFSTDSLPPSTITPSPNYEPNYHCVTCVGAAAEDDEKQFENAEPINRSSITHPLSLGVVGVNKCCPG